MLEGSAFSLNGLSGDQLCDSETSMILVDSSELRCFGRCHLYNNLMNTHRHKLFSFHVFGRSNLEWRSPKESALCSRVNFDEQTSRALTNRAMCSKDARSGTVVRSCALQAAHKMHGDLAVYANHINLSNCKQVRISRLGEQILALQT